MLYAPFLRARTTVLARADVEAAFSVRIREGARGASKCPDGFRNSPLFGVLWALLTRLRLPLAVPASSARGKLVSR